MSGFTFDRQPEYCELKFTPELSQMAWADVEAATKRVTELVHDDHTNSVLVDLSELTSMPSGIVASLVRTWKGMDERKRKLVVVSTADKVTQELEQTGLASLWTLTDDRSQAYRALGVQPRTDDDDQTVTAGNAAFAEASQPVTNEPYGFKEARAFCGIQMNPILMAISWEEMEQATTDVISQYNASKIKNVLVDVSRMEMINSGLVAALVRVWKAANERNGKFSLVSPNDMVTGVLKSAGLWKLWHVVDDRDEAVYSMGVSSVVTVGGTDSAPNAIPIETPIAASCAVLAAVGTGVMCFSKDPRTIDSAQLFSLLFAGGAVATGTLALFRDTGKRKLLACAALIVGLGVMGMYLSGTRASTLLGLDSTADSAGPDADSGSTGEDGEDGEESDDE